MSERSQESYTVAQYIVDRLRGLGATHIFQVPGNYTSDFLQTAQRSGVRCIGTTNEMEAGYAADACARIKGIGVACVTYGVGSMSLMNAIAGAYVERCPVVLINGSANEDKARQLVNQGVLFAHAIDTIRTDELIFRPVTVATAVITSGEDAPAHIDRSLRACLTERRPVYLEVRDRVWLQPCDRPAEPLRLEPTELDDRTVQDIERSAEAAATVVVRRLAAAQHPLLWGGEELQRFGVQDQFDELVAFTRLPYTTTLLGKAVISERNDRFIGVYDSRWAPEDTLAVVNGSDCIVALGTIPADFYGEIIAKAVDKMVLAAGGAVRVGRSVYPHVPLDIFVHTLLDTLKKESQRSSRTVAMGVGIPESGHTPPAGFEAAQRFKKHEHIVQASAAERSARHAGRAGALTHSAAVRSEVPEITWDSFFSRMHEFVDERKFVLADTSLALFPAAELFIPQRDHFICQAAWLSIGYTVGAIVGVSMLLPEGERAVAFVGDGGFQTIPQAFSTLVRHQKPALIFVMDNRLYAIEQFLIDKTFFANDKSPPVFFNELPVWNYVLLAEALGGKGFSATTTSELEAALGEVAGLVDVPALIAVRIKDRDLPKELRPTAQSDTAAFAMGSDRTRIAEAGFN